MTNVPIPGPEDAASEKRALTLAALIRRVWRGIAKSLESSFNAKPIITLSDATQVRAAWKNHLGAVLLGQIEKTYLDGAGHVAEALDGETELIGEDPVITYLAAARNRLVGVGDDVWQDVRAQIQLGINANEDVKQIAQRVRNVAKVSDKRSLTIARTETHMAYEAGAFEQALFVDPNATKVWLATNDAKTRPSHKVADGQEALIGGVFQVGGTALRFPGDPLGDPSETINCRCSTMYEFADAPAVNEDQLQLVAAGKKWQPSQHPRGSDGKFIEKGSISNVLSKKKLDLSDVESAAASIVAKPATWNELTSDQQSYISEQVSKLPSGFTYDNIKKNFEKATNKAPSASKSSDKSSSSSNVLPTAELNAIDLAGYSTGDVIAQSSVTGDYVEKNSTTSIVLSDADGAEINSTFLGPYDPTISEFIAANSSTEGWSVVPQLSKITAPSTITPMTPTQTKIPAGLKGKPGDPAKVTTSVIWGKHPAGTIILEAGDELETYVEWDGKKYQHVVQSELVTSWTKKDAYANLKNDTHWVVPSGVTTSGDTPALANTDLDDKKLDVSADPMPFTSVISDEDKDILLEDAGLGPITQYEAVELVKAITADDFSGLNAAQKSSIATGLAHAITNNVSDSAVANAKWTSWMKFLGGDADTVPTPDVVENKSTEQTFQTSESISLKEWKKYLAETNHPAGTLIARSASGNERVIASDSTDKYPDYIHQKLNADGTWTGDTAKATLSTIIAIKSGWLVPQDTFNAAMGNQTNDVTPAVTPLTVPSTKLSGPMMSSGDWYDIPEIMGELSHGQIISVSSDGTHRVVFSDLGPNLRVELWDGYEWVADANYPLSSADVDDPNDSIDQFLEENATYTWLKPTAADITDPIPTSAIDPPVFSHEDIIENWDGVLGKSYAINDVVALSTVGDYQLVKWSSNSFQFQAKNDGVWSNVSINSPPSVETTAQSLAPTWVVPPKKIPTTSQLSPGELISSKTAFAVGLISGKHDDIIVVGTLPTVNHAEYRLRVSQPDADDEKAMALEFKNTLTDSGWVNVGSYLTYDEFTGDWPGDTFQWKPTSSKIGDQASEIDTSQPSPVPSTSAPAVSPITTTVENGGDTTFIPTSHKKDFKKTLISGSEKIGYWSKPEKIWDAIKQIQANYSDPNNPGQSKYTPLQILKSLDEFTNTKTPNVFTNKINKWASTVKGSTYIGGIGSNPLSVQTPKTQTPKQLADAVWKSANTGSVPTYGDAILSGTNYGIDVKIVSASSPGGTPKFASYVQVAGGNSTWKFSQTVDTPTKLEGLISAYNLKPTVDVPSTPASTTTVAPPTPKIATLPDDLDMKTGDISHLSDQQKQEIYADFKKIPSTYLDSPVPDIFIALKSITSDNNISMLQTLRVIDDVGAKKVNSPNKYLFEQKIKDWLKTPKGAAIASGAPVPKPPKPELKIAPPIPSFAASNAHKYGIIHYAQANSEWAKSNAQYGAITGTEKAGLKAYTGGIFYSINAYLRGETDYLSPTNENTMLNAQKGMRPSVSALLLHRGVGYDGVGNAKSHDDLLKLIGQTWKNDGFSSASIGGKAAFDSNPVIMEIEAPPGTPMAWVDPFSLHKGENEMLLAAGLNFKIISVTKKSGSWQTQSIVRLRVVPEGETA